MKTIFSLLTIFSLAIFSISASAANYTLSHDSCCAGGPDVSGFGVSDGLAMNLTTHSTYSDSSLGDYTITELSIFNITTGDGAISFMGCTGTACNVMDFLSAPRDLATPDNYNAIDPDHISWTVTHHCPGNLACVLGVDKFQLDVISEVPLPASAWLFGSAIFSLISFKRKN